MRLAKFLAAHGVASRRASEEVIRAGRVAVNGQTVTDPARAVGSGDVVVVDGRELRDSGERIVLAVHKPAGVVSTASDPQRRPTVVSLVPAEVRLYPIGRLDIDTTGLILLTNDGELAYHLTHPKFEVPKTYRATVVNPPVRAAAVRALRNGVQLDDGLTAPARVRRIGEARLEIEIHEGRKRQIKRMCEAVGHPVRRLQRVAFGPLHLGDLPPGAWRRLAPAEVDALARAGGDGRDSPGQLSRRH
jgi:23S rRNA pseudouridine2605 synthase